MTSDIYVGSHAIIDYVISIVFQGSENLMVSVTVVFNHNNYTNDILPPNCMYTLYTCTCIHCTHVHVCIVHMYMYTLYTCTCILVHVHVYIVHTCMYALYTRTCICIVCTYMYLFMHMYMYIGIYKSYPFSCIEKHRS